MMLIQQYAFQKADLIHAWGPVMTISMRKAKVNMSKVLVLPKGIDLNTFEKLSKFIDYFAEHYEDVVFGTKHDTHSLLAKYVADQGITVSNRLGELFDFIVLRDNSNHMFEQGKLKPEHGAWDLSQKQEEWWKEKYG